MHRFAQGNKRGVLHLGWAQKDPRRGGVDVLSCCSLGFLRPRLQTVDLRVDGGGLLARRHVALVQLPPDGAGIDLIDLPSPGGAVRVRHRVILFFN